MSMSREQATALAIRICDAGMKLGPADIEITVLVSDAEGDWIGVSSSTGVTRTKAILESALDCADYRDHTDVIDMEINR